MSRTGGGRTPRIDSDAREQDNAVTRSEVTMASQRRPWLMDETRRYWPLMTAYERSEHIIAFILSLLIAVLIMLALAQLFVRVVPLLVTGALDPLDQEVFQACSAW
jgi:hypothetical protein